MRRILSAFILILVLSTGWIDLFAQCTSPRYLNSIFASTRTISAQEYENAESLAPPCSFETITVNLPYTLDVYEPVGDTLSRRPCLVYAHGGGFIIGDKRIIPVPDFCSKMAERGFVVVSLDYRKCFNALSSASAERAVYRAIQDMRAAIRWARSEHASLKIDTNMVFAGGNSAGSIMAIQSAYVTDTERLDMASTSSSPNLGCLDCSGNSLTTNGRPVAVVNLWGAIYDTTWMDVGEQIPIVSIHGDADIAVFPDSGKPFSDPIFPQLYGSIPIHDRANSIGLANELYLLPGEGHEPWLTSSSYVDSIAMWASSFLYNELLMPEAPVISGPDTICLSDTFRYAAIWDSGQRFCWDVTGATIIGASPDSSWIDVLPSGVGTMTMEIRGLSIHEVASPMAFKSVVIEDRFGPYPLVSSGDSLTTTPGFSYQWYLDDSLLPGFDGYAIPVSSSGNYQVLVQGAGGCSFLTESVLVVGIEEDLMKSFEIQVFQRNLSKSMEVDYKGTGNLELEIIDLNGRIFVSNQVPKGKSEISLTGMADGLYLIRFFNPSGTVFGRLFKSGDFLSAYLY